MKRFEYEITKHPSDPFSQVAYFCSEVGECSVNEVPGDQTEVLADILNERGKQGWEFIQPQADCIFSSAMSAGQNVCAGLRVSNEFCHTAENVLPEKIRISWLTSKDRGRC